MQRQMLLLSLEQAVVDLQGRVEDKPSEDWLEKLIGSVSDEEAFLANSFNKLNYPSNNCSMSGTINPYTRSGKTSLDKCLFHI